MPSYGYTVLEDFEVREKKLYPSLLCEDILTLRRSIQDFLAIQRIHYAKIKVKWMGFSIHREETRKSAKLAHFPSLWTKNPFHITLNQAQVQLLFVQCTPKMYGWTVQYARHFLLTNCIVFVTCFTIIYHWLSMLTQRSHQQKRWHFCRLQKNSNPCSILLHGYMWFTYVF
jgi:hypothetical protein